jgi:hypothetical protein
MAATKDLEYLERDPDFWWLRFRYALREGRLSDAEEARQRLGTLGIEVNLHSPEEEAVARAGDGIAKAEADRHEAEYQAICRAGRQIAAELAADQEGQA